MTYSENHPLLRAHKYCSSEKFDDDSGIVNGAKYTVVKGKVNCCFFSFFTTLFIYLKKKIKVNQDQINLILFFSSIGSMQDFNYAFSNCFELTIFQSCCKFPNKSKLEEEWKANKESLLAFIQSVRFFKKK